IIYFTALLAYDTLTADAEKLIMVIPSKQIRRSPLLPTQTSGNASPPAYLKITPHNSYGPLRPGVGPPPSNQRSNTVSSYEQRPVDGVNHGALSYGKNFNYAPYSRSYLPYKLKGTFVPFFNQNRYPSDGARFRPPMTGPMFPPAPPAATAGFHHRPIDASSYSADKNPPIKLHQIDRPLTQPFGFPPPHASPLQSASASNYYPKVGPIIVKDMVKPQYPQPIQPIRNVGDLVIKETENPPAKAPIVPAAGPTGSASAGVVVRDQLMFGGYDKKLADFTKSWPKLSAFSETASSGSSYFPDPQLNKPLTPSNVVRNSNHLETSNSIGRKGYAVTEDINEPPFETKTSPYFASSFQTYPSLSATFSPFKRNFG
ncbi:hypothetical protein QAD02_008539, partial [Eretmocerus hayati]